MPTGPRGERRPADAIGAANMVAKIATGEIEESPVKKSGRVRSGKAGAKARAEYVNRDGYTTNNVENFFGVFKKAMVGVYHFCGEQHLQRYLNEFSFRYSILRHATPHALRTVPRLHRRLAVRAYAIRRRVQRRWIGRIGNPRLVMAL